MVSSNTYLSHNPCHFLLGACVIRWKWSSAEISNRSKSETLIFPMAANMTTYL